MLPLITTVFIASLFGSLHCVGMCGPLAMLASSSLSPRHRNQRQVLIPAMVAYHGSRLMAYTLAGGLAGLIGAGIQETGSLLGTQRLAARLAGGTMLVIGLLSIVRLAGGTSHAALLPVWLQKRLAAGHAWARGQSPLVRASVIGLLTAILPCGWLFAFLIVAAGTAQPLSGAMVMAVFALGSVPALAGLTLSMTLLVGRFRFAIPWASAVLITLVGAMTLLERSQVHLEPLMARSSASPQASHADHTRLVNAKLDEAGSHASLESGTQLQQAAANVQAIDHKLLPCCQAAADRAARIADQENNKPIE